MKISLKGCVFDLLFRHPFGIAHGERKGTETIFIRASAEGYKGYGEAGLPPYLGYDGFQLLSYLPLFSQLAKNEGCKDPESMRQLLMTMKSDFPAPFRAALDIALWDLDARMNETTVEQLIHIPDNNPYCFYTLAFSSVDEMDDRMNEAVAFNHFKLKTGSNNDNERITRLSQHGVKFCVDMNQSGKNIESVIREFEFLQSKGCLFVEQPFPVHDQDSLENLYNKNILPIILDESVRDADDYIKYKNICHGINIKLVKCGGITPALELMHAALADEKIILIGCMSEGSCGAAAAAVMRGYVNYIDLDGPALIINDPFTGVYYEKGRLQKQHDFGHAATLDKKLHFV